MLSGSEEKKKSPSLMMIENAVHKTDINYQPAQKNSKRRKISRTLKSLPAIVNELKPPANGKEYTKRDFVVLMDLYKD